MSVAVAAEIQLRWKPPSIFSQFGISIPTPSIHGSSSDPSRSRQCGHLCGCLGHRHGGWHPFSPSSCCQPLPHRSLSLALMRLFLVSHLSQPQLDPFDKPKSPLAKVDTLPGTGPITGRYPAYTDPRIDCNPVVQPF